jgi:hypothetical protein
MKHPVKLAMADVQTLMEKAIENSTGTRTCVIICGNRVNVAIHPPQEVALNLAAEKVTSFMLGVKNITGIVERTDWAEEDGLPPAILVTFGIKEREVNEVKDEA